MKAKEQAPQPMLSARLDSPLGMSFTYCRLHRSSSNANLRAALPWGLIAAAVALSQVAPALLIPTWFL